jgi:hypothetical protein
LFTGSGPDSRRLEHWNKDLPERNRLEPWQRRANGVAPGRPVNRETAGPAGRVARGNGVPRRPRWGEPEVVFRIVHVALDDVPSPPSDASPSRNYREQVVEIVLGPNPTFKHNGVGMLTRRVP